MDMDIDYTKGLIDQMIQESLDKYIIYNPSIIDTYINDDVQNDMLKYIIKDVINNMSDSIRELLAMVYRFKTDKDLIIIINEKAKLAVIKHAFEQNSVVDDDMIEE